MPKSSLFAQSCSRYCNSFPEAIIVRMFFERHESTGSASNPIGDPSKETAATAIPFEWPKDISGKEWLCNAPSLDLISKSLHINFGFRYWSRVIWRTLGSKPRVRSKDANANLPAACSEARFWVTNVDASVASPNGAFERSSDEAPRWASPTGIQTAITFGGTQFSGIGRGDTGPIGSHFFISKPQLQIRFFNC